ncbi:hypothetical protein SADUNF_Sadunf11G0116500 [Salix dunnii]|uniref:Uncharacterized protein n=1 Tax=Salix dunnii TaxID=1413687 RepID=A0A835MQV4_9ROSI|nr:hypothetical protein SADUNF_Sadunf11G0116500 [Salix dunnii]
MSKCIFMRNTLDGEGQRIQRCNKAASNLAHHRTKEQHFTSILEILSASFTVVSRPIAGLSSDSNSLIGPWSLEAFPAGRRRSITGTSAERSESLETPDLLS